MADREPPMREPIEGSSRRSGEMQSRLSPPATPHSTHDLLLLAAAADRHPDPGIVAAAGEQVARCAACATAAAELRALATSLVDLPHTRTAPRDMRLTTHDAARLRRGQTWRRILRPFGAGGLPGLKPLAAALTTFGLAGLLLTVPFSLGGLGAAAPALAPVGNDMSGQAAGETDTRGPGPNPAATASVDAAYGGSKGQPSATPGPGSLSAHELGGGSAAPGDRSAEVGPTVRDVAGPQVPTMILVSLGLTVAGLGLFAVLLIARRVA